MPDEYGEDEAAAHEAVTGLESQLSPSGRRILEELRRRRDRQNRAPRAGRLLYGIVLALPVAFLFGLGEFVWPLLVLPLMARLARGGRVFVPRLMWIWAAFYVLVLISSIAALLEGKVFALTPILFHASAALLLIYVFNTPVDELPDRFIVRALALYWVIVVAGGFLGILFGTTTFPSFGAGLVGTAVDTSDRLFQATLVQFSDPLKLGEGVVLGVFNYRPKGFFAFTNHWGSAFVILLPAALMASLALAEQRWRRLAWVTFFVALIPFVISRNRVAWLSLVAAGIYAVILLWRPHPRLAKTLVGILVLALVVVALTPMRALVGERLDETGSHSYRSEQYERSFELIEESPWTGFGVVQEVRSNLDSTRDVVLGVDSQILSVMIKHGIPATFLLFGWLIALLWVSRKVDSTVLIVGHLMVVVALIQSPWYGLLPHRWHVLMLGAGAMLRHLYIVRPAPAGSVVLAVGKRERPAASRRRARSWRPSE